MRRIGPILVMVLMICSGIAVSDSGDNNLLSSEMPTRGVAHWTMGMEAIDAADAYFYGERAEDEAGQYRTGDEHFQEHHLLALHEKSRGDDYYSGLMIA